MAGAHGGLNLVGRTAEKGLLELGLGLAGARLDVGDAAGGVLGAALELGGHGVEGVVALVEPGKGAQARHGLDAADVGAVEDSETILNRPSSEVLRACVPPHSSRLNGTSSVPQETMAHHVAVLLAKQGNGTGGLASSMPQTFVTTGLAEKISTFTRSSTSCSWARP